MKNFLDELTKIMNEDKKMCDLITTIVLFLIVVIIIIIAFIFG